MKEYLKSCNFEKYFKKLIKKLQGKRVIVYGTGSMFQYIVHNYDLSKINIIGVSDNKYLMEQEGQKDLGYKIIPKDKIAEYSPDVILLGVKDYIGFQAGFYEKFTKNIKTIIYPCVKISLFKFLKDNYKDLLLRDYEVIQKLLLLLFQKNSEIICKFCWSKKVEKNSKYINRNKKKVFKKLRAKFGKEPLKVVFYVYDASRWKSQTVYDLMVQDKNFDPLIVVTKNYAPETTSTGQSKEDVLKVYNFFKNKGVNVQLGYDFEKNEFIPFEKFKPDIIFYSHPWYVYKTQGPVMCSKFALTYYVPYFLANTSSQIEYDLRFHQYVHKYYVPNKIIKDYYHTRQRKKSGNLVSIGHPQLDYFYLNPPLKEKKYVIYAPHWTVCGTTNIGYSTFLYNGEFILDFAKQHPEIQWVFKPHPSLYNHLLISGQWEKSKIDKYWAEWQKIGLYYNTGDYLGLFNESYAMITDCGSFLTEYLLTEQPCIHLVSSRATEYNDSVKKIVQSYYQAHNQEELTHYLNEVIIKKNDYKKEARLDVLNELGFKNNYCAKNIIEDIKKELEI